MLHTVLRTRADNIPVTTAPIAPPAIVTCFEELIGIEARINLHRCRQEGVGLESITTDKNTLRRITCQTVAVIAGIIQSWANATPGQELTAAAAVTSFSKLEDGFEQSSANACAAILALITPENRPILTSTYGLTPALEETAQDLLDEYAARIGAPRDARIAFRTAGEQIAEAIAQARAVLIKRLDPLMRQYTLPTATPAQRQYHATYTAARITIDLKGPRRKKKPAADGTDGGGI
jgi:hypothetical protein